MSMFHCCKHDCSWSKKLLSFMSMFYFGVAHLCCWYLIISCMLYLLLYSLYEWIRQHILHHLCTSQQTEPAMCICLLFIFSVYEYKRIPACFNYIHFCTWEAHTNNHNLDVFLKGGLEVLQKFCQHGTSNKHLFILIFLVIICHCSSICPQMKDKRRLTWFFC